MAVEVMLEAPQLPELLKEEEKAEISKGFKRI